MRRAISSIVSDRLQVGLGVVGQDQARQQDLVQEGGDAGITPVVWLPFDTPGGRLDGGGCAL